MLPFVLLLSGCGLGDLDPGDAYVEVPDDDDDSAAIDDDDVADDDDQADDDDDDVSDDDDAAPTGRAAIVWVVDRYDWTAPTEGADRLTASAAAASDGLDMLAWKTDDGLPLPGGWLHPDVLPEGLEEGCEPIASDDPVPLPTSEDAGALTLASEDGGSNLSLEFDEGSYRLQAEGPPDSASWGLDVAGSATWPGSETDDVLVLAERPTDILPTPGITSGAGLANLHVGWLPGDADVVELLAVRFATPGDDSAWSGVRCVAVDDGTYTVDATALASAGSGEIQMMLTRATWLSTAESPSDGRPAIEAGGLATVAWRLTPQ